jgi:pimeloyl-ACP methyl ester carboxylesterase
LPTTRLSSAIPAAAGHFRLRFYTSVEDKPLDMCVVVSNSEKIAETKGKVPVLIFLHGVSERGSNGDLIFTNGPAAEMMRRPELNDGLPVMVISPQCPIDRAWGGMQPATAMSPVVGQLVDLLTADPRVDADRIYLTGISQGGRGLWYAAMKTPKAFAALVPIASGVVKPEATVPAVKDIPTWIVVGEKDNRITQGSIAMAAALKQAGAPVDFSELAGVEHDSWHLLYANPQFYDWLLTHVRGQPVSKQFTAKELMQMATKPVDDPMTTAVEHDFHAFDQYWQIVNCGRDGWPGLREQMNGHKNVFVARPLNAQVPCVMMTESPIPKDKHAKLNLSVGRDAGEAWRLTVLGDGKELLNQTIDATTAKDGWLDTSIDLGAWTGKYVRLQVLSYQVGAKPASAYFAKLSLDQE